MAPLDYRYFIEVARPAFAERVGEKNVYNRFQTVEYVIPQTDEDDVLEGCSVVDMYNYFFLLAVINSEQEGGKAIFRQIRTYLATFNSFQPDNHKIIEAFAQLFTKRGLAHATKVHGHETGRREALLLQDNREVQLPLQVQPMLPLPGIAWGRAFSHPGVLWLRGTARSPPVPCRVMSQGCPPYAGATLFSNILRAEAFKDPWRPGTRYALGERGREVDPPGLHAGDRVAASRGRHETSTWSPVRTRTAGGM
jgi:hypothetical protein